MGEGSESRPYTGPTGIRLTETGLQIDGYPDAAHLVTLKSERSRRLAVLRSHQATLTFCEAAMHRLGAIPSEGNWEVREAILVGIVARYFSCFGINLAGGSMSAKKVFKGEPPEAIEGYEHWKALRDKTLIHSESQMTTMRSAAALRADGGVEDVVSLQFTQQVSSDQPQLQLLYELISHTLKFVIREIDGVLPAVFAELNAMPPEVRLALPGVTYSKPTIESVFKTRDKDG